MKATLTPAQWAHLCQREKAGQVRVYGFDCKQNPLRYEVEYNDLTLGQQELPVQTAKPAKRAPIAPPGVHGRGAMQNHLQKGN